MFLKKIEINGFKSFAKKSVLDFSGTDVLGGKNIGITAIVGPNGSGKSNVADALRWVLGEQSVKSIRGKKAQDMIFAGSGKKSQLGSAQVSLYLDNSDRKLELDYKDVVISRKIYRSGESEYLINGSRVRLVDVVDLLAKAGIGQRSYCIINQGMADAILNASALERRSIIEEAAGVKEYQIKKERSQRKLKATGINLEKAKSLLEEITPHLKMLERQCKKAEKGIQYQQKLKEKQQALFGFLWSNLKKDQKLALEKQEMLARELMVIQREVDDLQDKLAHQKKQPGEDFSQKIAKLENENYQIKSQLSQVERAIIIGESRLELEKEKQKSIRMFEIIPVGADLIKKTLLLIRDKQEILIKKLLALKKIEEIDEVKKQAKEISNEISRLYEGLVKGKIEKKRPESEIENQKTINLKKIQEIMDEIAKAKKEKESLLANEKKISEKVRLLIQVDQQERKQSIKLEDSLRRRQFDLDRIKDKLNQAKIETAKFEIRQEDLSRRIRQEMNIEPSAIQFSGEAVEVWKFEQEIARLKVLLQQAGSVDETVIMEYQETKKRYEFLEKESKDLKEAMKSLGIIVKEMDEKIKDSYEKTFKEINLKFQDYFKTIFNGGSASLEKVSVRAHRIRDDGADEENLSVGDVGNETKEDELPIQFGVEIKANPPGKKITSLGMLSGGERTLTSLALLFSIISHNPPPFAILDEVEAALDESNSCRFGRILSKLSDRTQFVVITHNRETMRRASLLYGVTMNDDGISQLLSVKLDKAEEMGLIE